MQCKKLSIMANRIITGMSIVLKVIKLSNISAIGKKYLMDMKIAGKLMKENWNHGT